VSGGPSDEQQFERAAQLAGLSEGVVATREMFARSLENGMKVPYGSIVMPIFVISALHPYLSLCRHFEASGAVSDAMFIGQGHNNIRKRH
jgi:hypothetical protein